MIALLANQYTVKISAGYFSELFRRYAAEVKPFNKSLKLTIFNATPNIFGNITLYSKMFTQKGSHSFNSLIPRSLLLLLYQYFLVTKIKEKMV